MWTAICCFPDRSTHELRMWEHDEYFGPIGEVCRELGGTLEVAAPSQFRVFDGALWLGDRRLVRHETIIWADWATTPRLAPDGWTVASVMVNAEVLGYPTMPNRTIGALTNDKAATKALLEGLVPMVDFVQLYCASNADLKLLSDGVPENWFPVFAKPSSWGGGQGAMRCDDRGHLDAYLGLAAAANTAVIVEPSISVECDFRVFVIDGEAVAFLRREPGEGSHVCNASSGGSYELVSGPDCDQLRELARRVYTRISEPYFGLDVLLARDGRLLVSEVEIDGAIVREMLPASTFRELWQHRFSAALSGLGPPS